MTGRRPAPAAAGLSHTLAEALPGAAPGERLLVLATTAAVGAGALRWAEALGPAGWCHRVRIVEPRHDAAAEARAEIVAEALAFGARAIVTEADDPAGAIAREVAGAAGLPLVSFPRATP
ncbi:MAG: hypothetical protein ACKO5R_04310 [Planctomycetaceae bacterium]